jgi:putative glutamine amidotransferase
MKLKKPIIGVPVNVLVEKAGLFPGMVRVSANQDYLRCLELAGALPVLLPIVGAEEDIAAQLALVDGLLFTGGADLSPLTYGEEPAQGLDEVFPDMDAHQLALAKAARKVALPMLGICRGLQVLNVAFGGTLHQDLDRLPRPLQQHFQKGRRHVVSHSVDVMEGTVLLDLLGQVTLLTNSFHHQAVKDLAPGLRRSAHARDGVIEGLEAIDDSFVLGVQWHPEGMAELDPSMLRLFRGLVRACATERRESR